MIPKTPDTGEQLKNISSHDFLTFGLHHVAYIRHVYNDGEGAYAIHAADGTSLSVLETLDEALKIIHHNQLEFASVH